MNFSLDVVLGLEFAEFGLDFPSEEKTVEIPVPAAFQDGSFGLGEACACFRGVGSDFISPDFERIH